MTLWRKFCLWYSCRFLTRHAPWYSHVMDCPGNLGLWGTLPEGDGYRVHVNDLTGCPLVYRMGA